jgi:hypothetical protein
MNNSITFNAGGLEMLRLCDNGDIFVKDRLCTSDKETVRIFKQWLEAATAQYGDGSICRERTIAERRDGI